MAASQTQTENQPVVADRAKHNDRKELAPCIPLASVPTSRGRVGNPLLNYRKHVKINVEVLNRTTIFSDSEHAIANGFTLGPVIRPERFLFVKR